MGRSDFNEMQRKSLEEMGLQFDDCETADESTKTAPQMISEISKAKRDEALQKERERERKFPQIGSW
tara:strand:- start:9129 stop:9329 length:201 start_codon:yes stop_codon:yes gene_type:complete